MYKLFTDKAEVFECDIKVEGSSLNKSDARLVIETKDYSLLFKGNISDSGKCRIPIKKLKGLIDESSKGTIKLEVIAEDTYFTPWETNFEVQAPWILYTCFRNLCRVTITNNGDVFAIISTKVGHCLALAHLRRFHG